MDMDKDDGSIRSSVIVTTFFASVGLLFATVSFIFTSKWICCCDGKKSLLDIIAELPLVKKVKKTIGSKIKSIKCCTCCKKKDSDKEKQTEYEVNKIEGENGDTIKEKESESEQQDKQDEIKDDKFESDCAVEVEGQSEKEVAQAASADQGTAEEGTKVKRPLMSSITLNNTILTLYILSKVVLIIANVVFFGIARLDTDPSLSDEQRAGERLSYGLTLTGFANEIASIFFSAALIGMCRKCWSVTKSNFGTYYRYYDLQVVLSLSPIFSVHLHYLGGAYWILIIIRACVFSMTFIAAIVLGFRFFIAIWCFKLFEKTCCTNGEDIEIKNWKHLLKDIGFLLVPMTIKLTTSSSALATYFKIGILQSDPVKYTYLAVTILSCLNAISGVLYNAIVLRWIILKEECKANESKGSKALEFFKMRVPSAHISFALSVCINFTLIVLNAYILNHGNFR